MAKTAFRRKIYDEMVEWKVNGNNLFYYTMESATSNHLYEIDFLTSSGNKINPIEVKSGNYRGHNCYKNYGIMLRKMLQNKKIRNNIKLFTPHPLLYPNKML